MMSFVQAVLASGVLLVAGTVAGTGSTGGTGASAQGGSSAADSTDGAVSFDTSNAISLGSGCPVENMDVVVTATATGLHLSFSMLQIDLPEGDAQVSALLACSVRVPFQTPAGFQISGVTGTLGYGVDKDANASGEVLSSVLVSATPTMLTPVEAPRGAAVSSPALTSEDQAPVNAACGASGIFGVDVNLSGQKDGASDSMHLSVATFDVDVQVSPCP
jgi:hypothetical protein